MPFARFELEPNALHSLDGAVSSEAMSTRLTLGEHFEAFIEFQLSSGRYSDADEVVREALRLLEQKERRLAELDAAVRSGLADAKAGRLHDAEDVFDELDAELARLT